MTIPEKRHARRLTYWNGLIWAAGNGLVGGSLIRYLVLELAGGYNNPLNIGGEALQIGLIISLIIAAPQLAGLLRLATPSLIAATGSRKRFCIAAYVLSCCVLFTLPATLLLRESISLNSMLLLIAGIWCVYHLLEYFGTVALWSWIGDLVPNRIRGRFIGRRQFWLLIGQAVMMLASGYYIYRFHKSLPKTPRYVPYMHSAVVGTLLMTLSVVPLLMLKNLPVAQVSGILQRLRETLAPLADRRFLALIVFGCWLSIANGATQAAQGIYPIAIGIPLLVLLALRTMMRCGQMTISPPLGKLADRIGNRRLMIICLPIVAIGPAFYLLAEADKANAVWWFAGAWIAWIAWAGINIALPNLMLRLSNQSVRGKQTNDSRLPIAKQGIPDDAHRRLLQGSVGNVG